MNHPLQCQELVHALVSEWLNGMGPSSNPDELKDHWAYRNIISKRDWIVPFLLREVAWNPSFIVWALHDITGENPVPRNR